MVYYGVDLAVVDKNNQTPLFHFAAGSCGGGQVASQSPLGYKFQRYTWNEAALKRLHYWTLHSVVPRQERCFANWKSETDRMTKRLFHIKQEETRRVVGYANARFSEQQSNDFEHQSSQG